MNGKRSKWLSCTAPLWRLRHRRGHGIHSPLAYSIVRNVFMNKNALADDTRVLRALERAGVDARRAMQVQNLFTHCGFGNFAVDSPVRETVDNSGTLFIATPLADRAIILSLAKAASGTSALCILAPSRGRRRREICGRLAAAHYGLGIGSKKMMLLFYDKGLNHQYIIV